MKRKAIAFALTAALVLAAVPSNALVGLAEEAAAQEIADVEAGGVERLEAAEADSETPAAASDQTAEDTEGASLPEEAVLEEAPVEAEVPEAALEEEQLQEDAVWMEDSGETEDPAAADVFLESVELVGEEEAEQPLELAEDVDGTDFDSAIALELKEPVAYQIPSWEDAYFCYKPVNTGYYTFSVDVEEWYRMYGTVYEGKNEDNEIKWSYGDGRLETVAYLTGGTEYYFVVNVASGTNGDTFSVMVSDEYLYVEAVEDSSVTGLYGEEVTLKVNASSSSSEITYAWSYGDYGEEDGIPCGGNSNTLNVTIPKSSYSDPAYYKCTVTAGDKSKSVYFEVYAETCLAVDSSWYSIIAPVGTSRDLKVVAETHPAYAPLSYRWYDGETELAETSDTLHITVSEKKLYTCVVSDAVSENTVEFHVTPGGVNGTLSPTGGTVDIAAGATVVYSLSVQKSGMYLIDLTSADGNFEAALCEADGAGFQFFESYEDWTEDEEMDLGYRDYSDWCNLSAGETYYLMMNFEEEETAGTCNVRLELQHEHTFNKEISRVNPTCTENGSVTYECDYHIDSEDGPGGDCGAWHTQVLPALGHRYGSYTVTKPATCTSTGIRTYTCTAPGCGATKTEVIPAIAVHNYGAYVVTKAPTALAEGTQTRTCTICGATQTAAIAKLAPTIKVNVTKLPLKVKQSTTKVKVSGLAAGDSVKSWKSSNTKVATVSKSGKITGKKAGKAVITVTLASGKTAKITVTVKKTAVKTTRITGVSKKLTLAKGKKTTLKPVISPITSKEKVTYKTSNKKVATVNSKGKITAKKKGTAVITVKSGKITVKCKVTVK